MKAKKLSKAERKELGRRIDVERNRRGLTFAQLADKAGCGEKTVRKLVGGEPTRDKTAYEVCSALGLDRDEVAFKEESDNDHGDYSLKNFRDYVGVFYAFRRSLTFSGNILRSVFKITWSKKKHCLFFDENQYYESTEKKSKIDHSQTGEIYFSHEIGLLHFVTKVKGAVRLITVSKFRLEDSNDFTMHGIVLTQAQRNFHYQPSAAAIIFRRAKTPFLTDNDNKAIVIRPNDPEHAKLHADLIEVERNIVNFAFPKSA